MKLAKNIKKTLIRKISPLVLAIGMSFSPVAKSDNINLTCYNSTPNNNFLYTPETERDVCNYLYNNVASSFNRIKDEKQINPEEDIYTKVKMKNDSVIYLYTINNYENNSLETRMKFIQPIDDKLYLSFGGDSNNSAFLNIFYGSKWDQGMSVSFMKSENLEEQAICSLWKYWSEADIFTGVKGKEDKLLTIFAKMNENGFSFMYSNLSYFKQDYNFNQIIFGTKPGTNSYKINSSNAWDLLNGSGTVGLSIFSLDDPLFILDSPIEYTVSDFGVRMVYLENKEVYKKEFEILKYIDNNMWLSCGYETNNIEEEKVNLKVGVNNKKVGFKTEVNYNPKDKTYSGSLKFRISFK